MKTEAKKTGSWYSERNTTTEPCGFDANLEWIIRCGKRIALVKKEAS
jgi:hypothetical protein